MSNDELKKVIEAALLASDHPLTVNNIKRLFEDQSVPKAGQIKQAIQDLMEDTEGRGVELREVASGYRYQVRQEQAQLVAKLWDERPPRYTKALLETLALIAYRQPVTRGEIEDVRGVSVSSSIVHSLMERQWIKVIGHKEVPGRPALYATTPEFLDYFNLQNLEQLPTLEEIADLERVNPELALVEVAANDADAVEQSAETDHPSEGLDQDSGEDSAEDIEIQGIEVAVVEDTSNVTKH